jgi:thiamine monophosphate kinase
MGFLIQLVADVAAMIAAPRLATWRYSLPVVLAISAFVIALHILSTPE